MATMSSNPWGNLPMSSSVPPEMVRLKIPLVLRYIKKMAEDVHPSLMFMLNPRKQRQAVEELALCKNVTEYIAFTAKWLVRGACQNPSEIQAALDYIGAEQPRHICEIGTLTGGTTIVLSRALPSVDLVIGVDIYIKNRCRLNRFRLAGQKMHFVNGSSYVPGTVERVEKILKGRQLDVLFIDGDHRYEGAKRDFQMYCHLVRDNGFIVFHDIVPDHRMRYGRPTRSYSGGVPILWQELNQVYPSREFVDNPEQDGLGIGVLRYFRNP